jgi:uncharacterized membrane protein YfcA
VGAGGGFILVPALLLLYPEREPREIASIGLIVVFANSVSAAVAYARYGAIDYRSAAWFAAGAAPGAAGGALAAGLLPRRAFDALFGGLLLAAGLYIGLRRAATAIQPPVTGRLVARREIRSGGVTYVYAYHLWKAVASAAAIGFVSSLLGVGGGVIQVPVMVTALHFPIRIAAATSQFVLAFMSAEGAGVHLAAGYPGGRTLIQAAFLSIGAVAGGQAGARLSRRLPGTVIIRLLAAAMVVVGVRLVLVAVGV